MSATDHFDCETSARSLQVCMISAGSLIHDQNSGMGLGVLERTRAQGEHGQGMYSVGDAIHMCTGHCAVHGVVVGTSMFGAILRLSTKTGM